MTICSSGAAPCGTARGGNGIPAPPEMLPSRRFRLLSSRIAAFEGSCREEIKTRSLPTLPCGLRRAEISPRLEGGRPGAAGGREEDEKGTWMLFLSRLGGGLRSSRQLKAPREEPPYSLHAPAAAHGGTGLTSVSPDSVRHLDVGAKPPDGLDHAPDLQGQLIGGSQAEALGGDRRELSAGETPPGLSRDTPGPGKRRENPPPR